MLLSFTRRVGNKKKRKQTTLLINSKSLILQFLLFLVVVLAIFNFLMSLLIKLLRILWKDRMDVPSECTIVKTIE
jgi:hypothetical protein